jgi:hypothetical protein
MFKNLKISNMEAARNGFRAASSFEIHFAPPPYLALLSMTLSRVPRPSTLFAVT